MTELHAQYQDKQHQLKAITRSAHMMRTGYSPRANFAIVCGLGVFAVAVSLQGPMVWPQVLVKYLIALLPAVTVCGSILRWSKISTTIYPRLKIQLEAYTPLSGGSSIFADTHKKLLEDLKGSALSWHEKSYAVLDWVAAEKERLAVSMAYGVVQHPGE